MRYLPVYLDLDDRDVVLVGGGTAIAAKLTTLARTGARLTVYADELSAACRRFLDGGRITLHGGEPDAAAIAAAALVYLGHADATVNRRLRARARELGVPANTIDNAAASDFISPAVVDRAPVTVAVGSEGTAPILVRQIKAAIERLLPADTGPVARLAARLRPAVRSRLSQGEQRRFWQRFFDGAASAALRRAGFDQARRLFHDEVVGTAGAAADAEPAAPPVALVGAGPGDPDLLTQRARHLLDRADVVLFDRLVDRRIVDLARREATLVEVGKRPGGRSWRQDDINDAIVRHARTGRRVVRLKSGDPMVFGRADEELDALDAAGIRHEVVPGVTAAAAAAAALGRSLTRRERNSALTLLTAQDTAGYAEHDWRSLAAPGATSAVYMGVRAARFVQGRLLLHGAAPETPVTVVENASRPDEKRLACALGELPRRLEEAGIAGPAIIFVGIAPRGAPAQGSAPAANLAADALQA